MPPEPYLLLSLADPAPTPQGDCVRCLNTAGRWAVHGTAQAPLLAWPSAQAEAAQAAAERASGARGQPVAVLSREDAPGAPAHPVQLFTDACEPALHGPAAQSGAKARRLRTEADKLEAFCVLVRAASAAADQAAFAEVGRAASKALRAKFGGGSITSAFAWLAGRPGREALESILAGEVELAGPLPIRQLVAAVALARTAEQLRTKAEGPVGPA